MEIFRASLSSRLRWLRLGAVVLALLGQAGLVSASLTLARDETSAISHTERSGIDLHHAHNEATCAACQALSIQGPPAVLIERRVARETKQSIGTRVASEPGVQRLFPKHSRAPPRAI
jgi:hypothetical protein